MTLQSIMIRSKYAKKKTSLKYKWKVKLRLKLTDDNPVLEMRDVNSNYN